MSETQTNRTPESTAAPEQPLKIWVSPTFERTPLNEAMASVPGAGTDGLASYS